MEVFMAWKFIDPRSVAPRLFGLSEVYAVKVKKYDGRGDVRCFRLKGWAIFADLMDIDPRMEKQMYRSEWFVFAAKGRRGTHV
jgi:hypothetical protein